jgi:hypothetical protein
MGKAQLICVRLRYGSGGGLPPPYELRRQGLSEAEHLPVNVLYPINHPITVIDSLNGQSPTHSRACVVPVRKWTSAPPYELRRQRLSEAEHIPVNVLSFIDHLIKVNNSLNGQSPTHLRSLAVRFRRWTSALLRAPASAPFRSRASSSECALSYRSPDCGDQFPQWVKPNSLTFVCGMGLEVDFRPSLRLPAVSAPFTGRACFGRSALSYRSPDCGGRFPQWASPNSFPFVCSAGPEVDSSTPRDFRRSQRLSPAEHLLVKVLHSIDHLHVVKCSFDQSALSIPIMGKAQLFLLRKR